MGRMKLGIGIAGAVIVLAGVVAMATMSGGGDRKTSAIVASTVRGPDPAVAVGEVSGEPATQPAATTPTTEAQASSAGASGAKASTARSAPVTLPPNPTAADVQRVIAGITAQLLAPANPTASTTPMTKEQVEAQVREQLRQLGINF